MRYVDLDGLVGVRDDVGALGAGGGRGQRAFTFWPAGLYVKQGQISKHKLIYSFSCQSHSASSTDIHFIIQRVQLKFNEHAGLSLGPALPRIPQFGPLYIGSVYRKFWTKLPRTNLLVPGRILGEGTGRYGRNLKMRLRSIPSTDMIKMKYEIDVWQ